MTGCCCFLLILEQTLSRQLQPAAAAAAPVMSIVNTNEKRKLSEMPDAPSG